MLPLSFSAFLCFGYVLVLLGANQPALAAELGIDLAHFGLLASALALGIGVGVVAAGPLFDRLPRRPLFVASALLAAGSLLAVGPGQHYAHWAAAITLAGVGIGLYDTLINALIVQRYGEDAQRPMVAVHAAATLGAMLCPLAVAWIAETRHFTASFSAAGWAHLAIAAWAAWVPLPPVPARVSHKGGTSHTSWAPLLPIAAIAFAYVGVEAAATAFAVPYAYDGLGLEAARGQRGISAFWLGLLAGRLGMLALRRPLDEGVLGASGLGAAAVLAIAIGSGGSAVELSLGALGLCLGGVYPLMISLAGQRFPGARGMATGLAAGAGALGGFVVPWATGALGDRFGPVSAFGSLTLWCAALALAAFWARAHARRRL